MCLRSEEPEEALNPNREGNKPMHSFSHIAGGLALRHSAAAVLTLVLLGGVPASAKEAKFTPLYSFGQNSSTDAASPQTGSLLYDNRTGKLYDATWTGGASGFGGVFSIDPDGSEETVLYSFAGAPDDGAGGGGLIMVRGTLYGTTFQGGNGPCAAVGAGPGCGTVYSIKPDGTGGDTVLYAFQNTFDGFYGQVPLIYDKSTSKLYGVAGDGGQSGTGTVFSVNTDGSDPAVIYALGENSDAGFPDASVTRVRDKLYGTASINGRCNEGAVFWTNLTGTDHKVVHDFCGGTDGWSPTGPLTYVKDTGLLYGTTQSGGGKGDCNDDGCGTVFWINPKTGEEKTIYAFQGHPDGSGPTYTGVTYFNGKLYGVTSNGGTGTCPGGACGTVFSMDLNGHHPKVIHSFQGTDGSKPEQDLIAIGNTLYGTTFYGGAYGGGMVFSITP